MREEKGQIMKMVESNRICKRGKEKKKKGRSGERQGGFW